MRFLLTNKSKAMIQIILDHKDAPKHRLKRNITTRVPRPGDNRLVAGRVKVVTNSIPTSLTIPVGKTVVVRGKYVGELAAVRELQASGKLEVTPVEIPAPVQEEPKKKKTSKKKKSDEEKV